MWKPSLNWIPSRSCLYCGWNSVRGGALHLHRSLDHHHGSLALQDGPAQGFLTVCTLRQRQVCLAVLVLRYLPWCGFDQSTAHRSTRRYTLTGPRPTPRGTVGLCITESSFESSLRQPELGAYEENAAVLAREKEKQPQVLIHCRKETVERMA